MVYDACDTASDSYACDLRAVAAVGYAEQIRRDFFHTVAEDNIYSAAACSGIIECVG